MTTSEHSEKHPADITDIRQMPGVYVGHYTDAEAATGCTALVFPAGAPAGVDVRGGGPASRETDLLRPEEMVQKIHAVVLSGGSAFGLAASTGVAEELERRGYGFDVGVGVVPIVTSACLFDLACGRPDVRPGSAEGAAAVLDAFQSASEPLPRGNVGAGTGCSVGKVGGPQRAMKAGLGTNIGHAGDVVVAAVTAVNACGDVVDPQTGAFIAGLLDEDGKPASTVDAILAAGGRGAFQAPKPRTNTTISCIVTNAKLDKAGCTKVAQMAADAYAHAIRPTHTLNDGDTIFVVSVGDVEAQLDLLGVLATKVLETAIVDAAEQAEPAHGLRAARDLK